MKEFTLTDIAKIIVRHIRSCFLVAFLSFATVISLFLLAQPEYPISVRIMLDKSQQQAALDAPIDLVLGGGNSELTNEIEVFKSRVVLNELITRLNLDYVAERRHNSYLAYLFRRVLWKTDRSGGAILQQLTPSFRSDVDEFEVETVSETEYRISAHELESTTCPWEAPCTFGPHRITLKRSGPVSPGARYTYYRDSYPNVREDLQDSLYFEVLGDRKNANLLEVELTSRDPFVGAAALNELISIVIEKKLAWKRSEAEATRSFIKTVTDKIKTQLNDERSALADFQSKNKALLPEIQVQGFVTRTEDLVKNRQENDIRRQVLEEFLKQITESSNTAISSPVVVANIALEEMISAYNKALLLLKQQEQILTENHPQIITLRQQMEKNKNDIIAVVRDTIRNIANAQNVLDQNLGGIEKQISNMPTNIKNINTLYSSIITTERIYLFLNQKLYEAEILSGSTLSGIRLVDDADPWVRKSFPRLSLALLIALFIAFSLGLATAFFKNAITAATEDPGEIEAALAGYPVFARIPRLPEKHDEQLAAYWRETFRSLYTSIKFSSAGSKQIIGITSSIYAEGKSFVASALADICVDFGHKVVLIDTDMHHPAQQHLANGNSPTGLSGYLSNASISLAQVTVATKYGYDLIPAGEEPPNPASLLAGDRFSGLLQTLSERYEFIIIDTPSLYSVTDPIYIIKAVDVLLFVSSVGTAPLDALRQADALFFQKMPVEKRNIGIVINNLPLPHGHRGGPALYGFSLPGDAKGPNDNRIEKLKKTINSFRKRT